MRKKKDNIYSLIISTKNQNKKWVVTKMQASI